MQAIPKDLAKKLPISADAKKKKYSAEKIACFRRCMKKVGVKAQKECLKKCMTDKKKEVKSTDKIKQQKDKTKDKTTAKPERRSGGRGGGGGGGKGSGAPRVRQPPIVPTQQRALPTMQPPPLVSLTRPKPKKPIFATKKESAQILQAAADALMNRTAEQLMADINAARIDPSRRGELPALLAKYNEVVADMQEFKNRSKDYARDQERISLMIPLRRPVPAPVPLRVPDFSGRVRPTDAELQQTEDEIFAKYGQTRAPADNPVNPFRPSMHIPSVPAPVPLRVPDFSGRVRPTDAELQKTEDDVFAKYGMPSTPPSSPPTNPFGLPAPTTLALTPSALVLPPSPPPSPTLPPVNDTVMTRGDPPDWPRDLTLHQESLKERRRQSVDRRRRMNTQMVEADVNRSITAQQTVNRVDATQQALALIPPVPLVQLPPSLQSSPVQSPTLPPVQSHPEMTQIPGAKSSTSAYQGHNVDEPEALALALSRSIADGQQSGTPARVGLKETVQNYNSERRNNASGVQQTARTAVINQRRAQLGRRNEMENARLRNRTFAGAQSRVRFDLDRQAEDAQTSSRAQAKYSTIPAIRYAGDGSGRGAGATERGDYIDNTSDHLEDKDESVQLEFKSAE